MSQTCPRPVSSWLLCIFDHFLAMVNISTMNVLNEQYIRLNMEEDSKEEEEHCLHCVQKEEKFRNQKKRKMNKQLKVLKLFNGIR
jgi:hypothetical protein